jgi:hypothetical protein
MIQCNSITAVSHTLSELMLGSTWHQNPPVYLNFVNWVKSQYGIQLASHHTVLAAVKLELEKWNLELAARSVQGELEDLTAWMLAYA